MIPISQDVLQLIGDWAEQVDNRSLLYEKFALPKVWGSPRKIDNAGRWNVLRIVTRGKDLLQADAARLRQEANGRNVNPDVAAKKRSDADIAQNMARVAPPDPNLALACNENAKSLLEELKRTFPENVVTFEATLQSRLMVNMAGGVVENAGICLDRCFGLPYLPGSAVKGIARNQALWDIKRANGQEKEQLLRAAMLVFGFAKPDLTAQGAFGWAAGVHQAQEISNILQTKEFKGLASFLPAYPTSSPKLVVDLVNSHHPQYYTGRVQYANDNEEPRPNYFPAVEAGCSFAFAVVLTRWNNALQIPHQDLLEHTRKWIENAITQKGAGAKTAAGYGWFALRRQPAQTDQPAATNTNATPANTQTQPDAASFPAAEFINKWRGKLRTKDNFPAALPEMAALDDANLKEAFRAVIPEQETRRLKRNNPYWQSFTSGRHAEAGKAILRRLNLQLS